METDLINKNTDLLSNASGEHPAEFNLDFYNSIISNTDVTVNQLNNIINEVSNWATEYQRQSTVHASNQDYTNSSITDSWRDTALRTKDELIKKRDLILELKPYFDEGVREQQQGISEIGKIDWIKSNVPSYKWDILIDSYMKGRDSVTPPPPPPTLPPPPKEREETSSDEVFTTEDEESKKILGMPRGVAIGVGVLVLAVGGFFVYKKFIAKK